MLLYQISALSFTKIFLKYTSSSVTDVTVDKTKINCRYIAQNVFEFLSQIGERLLRKATMTIFSP